VCELTEHSGNDNVPVDVFNNDDTNNNVNKTVILQEEGT